MKLSKHILVLFVLLFCQSFAQETQTDTAKALIRPLNAIEKIQLRFDEFEVYRDKYYSNFHIPLDEDKATIRLRTEMIIRQTSQSRFYPAEENLYFLSPLYNQYIEDSKFNPVKYVLGIAQLSAVGYLAYRHIKKYGFID